MNLHVTAEFEQGFRKRIPRCGQLLIGNRVQSIKNKKCGFCLIRQSCARALTPVPPPTSDPDVVTPNHFPLDRVFNNDLTVGNSLKWFIPSGPNDASWALVHRKVLAP